MSTMDSYGVINNNSIPQPSPVSAGLMPNPAYTTDGAAAAYIPLMHQAGGGSAAAAASSGGQPAKRKRGRPRKYAPDGGTPPVLRSPPPLPMPPPPGAVLQSSGFSPPVAVPPSSSEKKSRGRPRGSGRKQQVGAHGSAGVGFTPHVITVKAGEVVINLKNRLIDVSSKIMSFSQNGTRTICILSANGAISNVTLRQAATSGGTVTYEGRFEILSLCGSYMLIESGGQRSRTGGLSVLLAGPDGRVLGGGVAGVLTAAAPVQVVVGCFIAGQEEMKSPNQSDPPLIAPSKLVHGASAADSPASRGTQSESSGGPGSPLNQSTGAYNNSNPQGMTTMSWQ